MVEDEGCPWLARSGYFRRVVGYREAHDLLADPRLHANMVELFEGLGITSGPFWDIARSSLLSLNGDEHRRLRALVAGPFTPRAVERVRPLAAAQAGELVGAFADRGTCELIADFATPYVSAGACRLIGFPPEDVDACADAVARIGSGTRDPANRLDDCIAGVLTLTEYGRKVLAARRADPREDVLSLLAALVAAGDVPEDVALALVATLMSAGLEPTINQIGLMVESLAAHPIVWDAVGTGRVGVNRAVEELLRFRSTNPGATRRVAEPLVYRGVSFARTSRSSSGSPRPTTTRRTSPPPTASIPGPTAVPTSRSGSDPTTASGPRWPASSSRRRSGC